MSDYEPHRAKQLRELAKETFPTWSREAATMRDAAEELESRARYFGQMQHTIATQAAEITRLTAQVAELRAHEADKSELQAAFDRTADHSLADAIRRFKDRAESAERERDEALAEVERVKPVVEAARAAVKDARREDHGGEWHTIDEALVDAVRDYETARALTPREPDNA